MSSVNKSILNLTPYQFRYTNPKYGDVNRLTMGIMAQEIEQVYPSTDYSILKMDSEGTYTVDYVQLIAPMLAIIKDQEERIIELEKIIKKEKNNDDI